MKSFIITYTLDLCRTVNTLTVSALDYTKAYLAAIIALPENVDIIEAKEAECALV